MCDGGVGSAWQGGMCGSGGGGRVWQGWGGCMAGGVHGGGGVVCVAGDTVTSADGTHPTGMHSCFKGVV